MLKDTLRDIGLSNKEIEVYLLVCKHQGMSASNISKIREGSRTHTYDILDKLISKSLVTYVIKNNVKHFKPTPPQKILDYLEEKKSEIMRQEEKVSEIIPEIKEKLSIQEKENFNVEIYEGKEGIKTVLKDILREGKDFVTFGASSKSEDYLPEFFIESYLNERKEKNIRAKQLFTDLYGVWEGPFSTNRKLPKEYAFPSTILIYGNKVTTWLWLEIPRIIMVENRELAKAYKTYFDLLWEATSKKKS